MYIYCPPPSFYVQNDDEACCENKRIRYSSFFFFFTTTTIIHIHIHIHTCRRAYRIRFRRTGIAACCGYRHRRKSWCVENVARTSLSRPLSHVLRFVLRSRLARLGC